jgi:hypothetical protein
MGNIVFSFTEPTAAMATNAPLIFVIATAAQLPQASTCLEVLKEAQATGPSEDSTRLLCLDRVPLSELSNSTCWFYPTHDGTFLSWERGLSPMQASASTGHCDHAASEPWRPGDGSEWTAKPTPASSSRIASRCSQLSR